ncbi:MAG: ABC transporter permease [Candidatus Omnitrophica bacterium]|nr:ABC transporter permease [Candidatus Omnitrophota bacterium]
MPVNFVVYQPDNTLKKGYLNIFREIFNEIRWNKYLTYQLFRRDFFAAYKQSFVGVFWAFIMPLFSIGTFVLLNRSGVFDIGDVKMPYPLFALLGLSIWQIFSSGVTSGANALANAGSMLTRINFSKKALILASLGKPTIILLFQLVITGVFMAFYRVAPSPSAAFLPFVLIPLFLFVLALCFILSLFNTFAKDVGNGLQVVMTFLMFLTPVLYSRPQIGLLGTITKFNPMYYFVSAGRDIVISGTISEWNGYLIACAASFVLFTLCIMFFHLTETRVTERI